MNHLIRKAFLVLLMVVVPSALFAKSFNVAVVIDNDTQSALTLKENFERELLSLSNKRDSFKVDKGVYDIDDSVEKARTTLSMLQKKKGIDAIVLLGVVSSQSIAGKVKITKTVIAPFLSEVNLSSSNIKGNRNISTITTQTNIDKRYKGLNSLKKLKRASFINSTVDLKKFPKIINSVKSKFAGLGLEMSYYNLKDSAQYDAFLNSKNSVVFVGELDGLSSSEQDVLIKKMNDKRMISIVTNGRSLVEKGMLLGLFSDQKNINYILRKTAVNVHRISRGDTPSKLSEVIKRTSKPIINLSTATLVGYSPNWNFLIDVEVIGDLQKKVGTYSFLDIIREAQNSNLDLKSRRSQLDSTSYKRRQAYNALLPKLDLSVSQSKVNEEQATFTRSEDMLISKLSLKQPLYDNKLFGNLKVADMDYQLNKATTKKVNNDIIVAAAKSYFGLLKGLLQKGVEERNLKNAKINLGLAKARKKIGSTSISDVYRWELETVAAKKSVVNASIQVDQAFNALNKLVNFDLSKRYKLDTISYQSADFKLLNKHFLKSASLRQTARLGNYIVSKSLKNSPGVKEAAIAQQITSKQLSIKKREFFAPTLALTSDYTKNHERGGVNDTPATGVENNWNVAVSLSFPIFEGGGKHSRYKEEVHRLSSATFNKRSVEQNYKVNIKNKLGDVLGNFQSVKFNSKSVELAIKNYALVKNKYRHGKASIVELLDSQNSLKDFETLLLDSNYNLLTSYVELQSLVGEFDFLMSDADVLLWENKFKNYN